MSGGNRKHFAFDDDSDNAEQSSTNNTSSEDEEPSTKTKSHRCQLPPTRNAANARERARMRVLARAFCRLKTTLPWVPADTKLSKLDTLRLATSYIAYLREVLMVDVEEKQVELRDNQGGSKKHPVTMSWPFSFGSASASTTADKFSSHCFTPNHLKSTSPSVNSSHKLSPSLPDCRSIQNQIELSSLHETKVIINSDWEITNDFSSDQRQLMACQQEGDKVSYY